MGLNFSQASAASTTHQDRSFQDTINVFSVYRMNERSVERKEFGGA